MAIPALMSQERALAIGLLVLRLGAGGFLLFGHGLPKLLNFAEKAPRFADPLHIGPTLSFTLATGAEVFGSLLVIVGLLTRPAAATALFTMLVAGLVRHAADPFARKELALLYAVCFATLVLTGPGPYSLRSWLARRRTAGGAASQVVSTSNASVGGQAPTAGAQP